MNDISSSLNIQILQLIENIKNKFQENDKLNQIIKIIKEDNEFESIDQLINVRELLFDLCKSENVETVKWLVKKEFTDKNGFSYKIDSKTKTASISSFSATQNDIFIPKSIEYNEEEYTITHIFNFSDKFYEIKSVKFDENSLLQSLGLLSFSETLIESISIPATVTSIGERAFCNCFELKSIEIPGNSQLKFIENGAFTFSEIESLFVPSGLLEFKKDWCFGAHSLKEIKVSPENRNFKFTEDKLLIGKSDKNTDNYDVLIFASRDIETVTIPSNITVISASAFFGCINLKNIEIKSDSKLQIIEKTAFSSCPIENIFIPSGLLEFKERWCFGAQSLKEIQVSPENRNFKFTDDKLLLGKTDKNTDIFDVLIYASRDIETVTIPSNITQISANAFDDCKNLKTVEFPDDCQLKSICQLAFSKASIEKIVIPKQVTEIGQLAFYQCINLKFVEIPKNSELKIIDEYAFYGTSIEEIYIPKNVTRIENCAFNSCEKLKIVNFEQDSMLNYIGVHSFSTTKIEKIRIPSQVRIIDDKAFHECNFLQNVEIPKESELKQIGNDAFSKTDINTAIYIPPHLKIIGNNAFCSCQNLPSVEIPKDSELQYIGKFAFYETSIEHIFIPQEVIKLEDSSFSRCGKLNSIEFSENSKLKVIGDHALSHTILNEISIPQHVTEILNRAFIKCINLKSIQIPENSELKMIDSAFSFTSITSLYIPSGFCEFQNSWCYKMRYLEQITISPLNHNFKFIDDKLLLGKSDKNTDNYDILIFAVRSIKAVTIPPNITTISSFAFNDCEFLESITIPPSVTDIGMFAFNFCRGLKNIEIPTNSQLKKLGTCAISNALIESLFIPSHLCEFEKGWSADTYKLNKLTISPENEHVKFINNILYTKSDQNSDNFDVINFCVRNTKKVVIPPNVTIIESCAFSMCFHLFNLKISDDSQLKRIDKLAFSYVPINKFKIPLNLTTIGPYAFLHSDLSSIEIPDESELQVIQHNAFSSSKIKSFCITPKVTTVEQNVFDSSELSIIEISEKSSLKSFDFIINLSESTIIMIPVNLEQFIQ